MAEAEEGSTVRVAVRVRPFSEKEIREGGTECVEVNGTTVTLHQDGGAPTPFAFDHVFDKDSTQPQVFDTLGAPMLDKAFEGYNATIFAYGQTGSGKTHTMMSDRKSDDRGLIPRISENLFERIAALTSETRKFLVCCSFLEIYNEIVYDLLVPRGKNTPKTGLEIREGKGIGVYVKDLQEIVVDSSDKLQRLIDQGFEHRATASTQMNSTSSRSHCLFIIKMHQKDDQNAANNNFSKMNLVDLAGSERASRTGAQGDTLKEGANINKSLSALGNVINALSSMASGNKKVFIPYRNSKLTRVLQESLGGNALCTMMAALSPSKTNAEETLSTLNYAKRAKTIKVNATKNEEAEQIAKLEEEIEALRSKLAEQASGVADTSRYETQIQEMEKFMKQTWEDKEAESQKHEEERKRLELEAQKNIEKANEERKRRLRMLEEKGDLELTMQELKGLEGGETWPSYTTSWPSQITKLLGLESRVTAQCRAATVLKDAVVTDLDHWVERRQQAQEAGGKEEDGGAGLRMLLQQAERKVASMLREFDTLAKQEQEVAAEVATLMPQIQRVAAGIAIESSQEKDEKAEEGKEAAKEVSEEYKQVVSLMVRQLDSHRVKIWGQFADDHKNLRGFCDRLPVLQQCCSELGADVSELSEEIKLELEVGGSSSSSLPLHGAEVTGSLAMPLGLSSEELAEESILASSNPEAASSLRLFSGVDAMKCAYSGWSPVTDDSGEYIQVDLGKPFWVCALSMQGRRPASGDWQATLPLLAQLLDPDSPLPPKRIFKRPPVRLVHDVVVAVHGKYGALAAGKPDFSPAQLEYKQLQNGDRQTKVDFFELLLAKTAHAIKGAGWSDKVAPLKLSPSDILGGKNTTESNRLLQILIYLGLRKKMESSGGESNGLLDVADQWVTKFTVHWSDNGTDWTPFSTDWREDGVGEAFVFKGCADAESVRYVPFGAAQPRDSVRYLRLHPQEWQVHPGLRLEVYGWPAKQSMETMPPSVKEHTSRLDVICQRGGLLQKTLTIAGAAAAERWKEARKAEEEKNQQALAERTQVEQQLQDTVSQLEELRKAYSLLQDKAADNEQKLIDTETDKLRLEVEKETGDSQYAALEEKLAQAQKENEEEKNNVKDLESKLEESKTANEDLQQQIGVLTEERDVARAREEELFETLNIKEEELMNTNDGYVYLTDQLNEVRDDFEDKIDQRDRVIETLQDQNKKLSDEGIKLRQDLGEAKRKVAEAEKAVQRAEQGLPINFRLATATTTASTPRAAEAEQPGYPGSSPHSNEEKTGEYQEDFEDD